MSKSEQVLKMLTKIPKGRVTTYGTLAKAAKTSPRAVGQMMRNNNYPEKYPCYKVVKSDGCVGGYDGCVKGKRISDKARLIRKDGVEILKGRIDLRKFGYSFSR